jgi:hypothetical protein
MEYENTIDDVLEGLAENNYNIAVEVLSLPEKIRGFGHVKESNRARAKREEEQLMAEFRIAVMHAPEGHDAKSNVLTKSNNLNSGSKRTDTKTGTEKISAVNIDDKKDLTDQEMES